MEDLTNITDEELRRVIQMVRTIDDVDLHINAPGDHHIYYSNKSAGGGILDVDANAGGQRILNPVENIYFADPLPGEYWVYILDYTDRSEGDTEYLVRVTIGDESQVESMRDCSVVTATYELGDGMQGTIGIIGPKRMDYEKVMNNLNLFKKSLNEAFQNGK